MNNKTRLPFKESHAFIIGINKYQKLPELKTAVNDAKKIAEILAKDQGFSVHPPLLDASGKDIKQLLEKTMIEKVGPGDRVFLYFAGHGIAVDGDKGPEGYIVPADAGYIDDGKLISMQTLHDAIKQLPCNHVLLVLDCCFAGSFKWSGRYRHIVTLMPKRIFKERFDRYVKDPAWQVITSSAHDQKALDVLKGIEKPIGKRNEESQPHSPFAKALFKGLQGAADLVPAGGDGLITASELYLYLRQAVELKTIKVKESYRQTPGIFPLEKHDKGEYIFLHPGHRLNLPSIPRRNPYKGLQSFEEKDNELFYGRERVIEDLVQKVDENNLIVVTGASGTGKSSVVKAGLIPELRKQDYNILPVVRPGNKPVDALEKAIRESNLFNEEFSLTDKMDCRRGKLPMPKNVLVIDQFEELVTQCPSRENRDRFIEILKILLETNRNNLFKIILTVRADFEPQFKDSALEPYWPDGRYTVPPFSTGELREVILKPTVQEVLEIKPPRLVDRIIHEVVQAPGALPLLSFTLSELYRLYIDSQRLDRTLHEKDYDRLGGVVGALHKRAQDIYDNWDRKHRNTLRKIMLRMVAVEGSELARKKVPIDDLVFSEQEDARVKNIIAKLLEARLLLKDRDHSGQTYVEPAHDALVRAWATLWQWIEEHKKEKISLQNRLGKAVKDYAIKKDKKYLWHNNPRLELVKNELQVPDSLLNRHEASFVEESIRRKKQKENKTRIIAISVIIILTGLLFLAIYKANEANDKARIANARYFTSQAQLKLEEEPVTAIRLAEKAYHLDKNETVMQVLSAAAATTFDHPFYSVKMRHNRPVNDVKFSPSGNKILTASSDKTAKLWDLQGNLLATFQHNYIVYSGEFSPDGTAVLTVSAGNSAKLWDLQGNLLQDFKHKKIVTNALFSPGGRLILTTSYDNIAKLRTFQGKHLKNYIHQKGIKTALFSPDGTRVLTISYGNIARLWDLDGSLLKSLPGVISAGFSPKGRQIFTVSSDNAIKLRGPDGNILETFNKHTGIVTSAAFSPRGTMIVTISRDNTAKLWDLHGQSLSASYKHKDSITSAAFSSDGSKVLTASADETAKLWNLQGHLIADLDTHKDMVTTAVFSPDGTKIVTASRDDTAVLWDLRDQPAVELNAQRTSVTAAAFSPRGNRVIIVSVDNTLKLRDLDGNLEVSFDGHKKLVNSAVFSPNGKEILTASADKTAKLWNLKGKLLKEFNGHTANVKSAVFSPDGRLVLTASFDNTAKLWDLQGKLLLNLDKHTKALNGAVFSPEGTGLLTVSLDGTARLWDLRGKLLNTFYRRDDPVKMAIFSPDGSKVLTTSNDAVLWDLRGQPLAGFKRPLEAKYGMLHTECTLALFSPDGSRILTTYNDNKVVLWDLQGHRLAELIGHEGVITSALFSTDSKQVLTVSTDHAVKLWDLHGNILSDFDKHKGVVYSAVFSPDGTQVLSASSDNTVKLWYTPKGIIQWLKTAQIPTLSREEDNLQRTNIKKTNKWRLK